MRQKDDAQLERLDAAYRLTGEYHRPTILRRWKHSLNGPAFTLEKGRTERLGKLAENNSNSEPVLKLLASALVDTTNINLPQRSTCKLLGSLRSVKPQRGTFRTLSISSKRQRKRLKWMTR